MVMGDGPSEWDGIVRHVMWNRTVVYLPAGRDVASSDGTYLMCRENAGYEFLLSVTVAADEVTEIEAPNPEQVETPSSAQEPEFLETLPDWVADEVDGRVGFMEDPPEIIPFELDCSQCNYESGFVDITPKIDLRIDGTAVRRVIEEYCPDCGHPSVSEYELGDGYRLASEMVDLDPWTLEVPPESVWAHARINN